MIEPRKASRCGNKSTGSHILDCAHTARMMSSKCPSRDSRNENQGWPEGTKTSVQKAAGREVRNGDGGTRRNRSRSARLLKNTRGPDSHSVSSRSRGSGPEVCALLFTTETPGPSSMNSRGRGDKTDPIMNDIWPDCETNLMLAEGQKSGSGQGVWLADVPRQSP